jgi:N-acetylated-alpha-linked acidic dipeptidase
MNDPRRPLVPPAREEPPPFLNLAPLQNGATRLATAATRFEQAYAALMKDGGKSLDSAGTAQLNALLFRAERALAAGEGLPRRLWYRQLLAAPGWYTGYAPKIMPGVREAIEAKRWAEAEAQAAVLGRALEAEAAELEQASDVMERNSRGN